MSHKSLVKNTTLLSINKLTLIASSFLLLPLYTSYFSASEYGLATLAVSYIAICAPLLTLRLDIGVFKHIVEVRDNFEKTRAIVSSFVFLLAPILCLFLIIATLVSQFTHIPYAALIVCNIITSIVLTSLNQFVRGIGSTNLFVLTSIITTAFSLFLSWFGVTVLGTGIEVMFVSSIISQSIGCTVLGVKTGIHKYVSIKYIDIKTQKKLLRYSLPLIPDSVSFWILSIADRTILSIFLGVASVGVYTVASKFSSILAQAVGVFFQSWTEAATQYSKKDSRDQLYSEVFSAYLRIFTSATILIVSLMPFAFPILIKGEVFMDAYWYAPVLLYAMIAHAAEAFVSSLYLANNLTKQIAKTTILGAVVNISIGLSLVHYIGVWAVVLSTLLGYLSTALYKYFNIRTYGISLSISLRLIVTLLLLLFVNAMFYYLNSPFGNVASISIAVISALLLNRASLRNGRHILMRTSP